MKLQAGRCVLYGSSSSSSSGRCSLRDRICCTHTPLALPHLHGFRHADECEPSIATVNGPSRGASPNYPQSQMPPVPNGKPTSPISERTNPVSPSAQIAAQTVSSKDPKAAAQAASDMRNVVRRKLTGYVGFANLPNQWHRKSVRKGFNFNVMVVGTYLHCLIITTRADWTR